MKYAMLATLIPHELNDDFYKNSRNIMQDAASVLQWNLYRGFCENLHEEIPIFNVLPVGSFPQYYKLPVVRQIRFDKAGTNIGFYNIKFFRNIHKGKKIYETLSKWCKQEQDDKTLFIYTVSNPFVKAVNKLKKEYPMLKVCAIVADLPDMSNLSAKKGLLQKVYVKAQAAQVYDKLKCIDAFVLLTKHMADYMNISQPFHVMEGIASEVKGREENSYKSNGEEKIILYTGTLHQKFGVLHLIKAFEKIEDVNARLVICGVGDSIESIKEASKKDARICFLGKLPREKVIELQQKATLLVNPRLNNEKFTKYSFPSKTMEYLASGVPVVAYKLDGIPDEYDLYIKYPNDNKIDTLADTICEMCRLTDEERLDIGQRGKKYVLENKNPIIQTRKILDFVMTI